MTVTDIQAIALRHVAEGNLDLRKISEPMRQRIIDLGMMDPPLVEVDADRVLLTRDGWRHHQCLQAAQQSFIGKGFVGTD
jgi:hypothetical protein